MASPRFYVPACPYEIGRRIELPTKAVHHAMRVLRLREGDLVVIFSGMGQEALGTIHFKKNSASVQITACETKTNESPLKITLIQSLISNEKLDWVIEKACELGVHRLIVTPSARSVIRLKEERLEKRMEHWQELVIAACSQCGRATLPDVLFFSSLKETLSHTQGQRYILAPGVQKTSVPPRLETVTFAVGPEGGFSDEEISLATSLGFETKLLGPRVLRTETAGLAAIAQAQTLWGDF